MIFRLIALFILVLITTVKYGICSGLEIADWDYLMYSQRWPISACVVWEDKNIGHKCNLPSELMDWVVHGLWPTKTGTDGPNKCDSAIHFDPDQLQPIQDELMNHWTNIEADTAPNSFWKHEWDKHGTCASILPELNSVINYFQKGLELNKEFNLTNMLDQSKISPNSAGYKLEDVYNAIKSVIKKNPSLHCETQKKTKDSMLSEIRICFDKSLEIVDCPGNMTDDCSHKKPVMYFNTLPQSSPDDFTDYVMDYGESEEEMLQSQKMYERGRYLLLFYRFVKFLMWFTL